ncbi:MAG: hypothetical protein ACO3LT_07575 [Ilumatobacteraceae bacterium]
MQWLHAQPKNQTMLTEEQKHARARILPPHREAPEVLPTNRTDFIRPRISRSGPYLEMLAMDIRNLTEIRNLMLSLVVCDVALVAILAWFGSWATASLALLVMFVLAIGALFKNDELKRVRRALEELRDEGRQDG